MKPFIPDDDSRLRDFVRLLVDELLEDPRFKDSVRQGMLLILSEQENLRKRGLIHSFFDMCAQRHVSCRLSEDGMKIMVSHHERMGPALEVFLRVNRHVIWEHLVRMRAESPQVQAAKNCKALPGLKQA